MTDAPSPFVLTPVTDAELADDPSQPVTIHALNYKPPRAPPASADVSGDQNSPFVLSPVAGDPWGGQMPGEGSPAGPMPQAYPPDPTRGYITPVQTPRDPNAPGIVGSVSNILYGNPDALSQLPGDAAALPAHLWQEGVSAAGAQFNSAAGLAGTGVQNLRQGNIVAGVPQTIVGTLGEALSPITGPMNAIGAHADPFMDPAAGHPAVTAAAGAPHGISASDVVPAIFGGIAAKGADLDALSSAKAMAKAGVDPAQIWKQEGWALGKDNVWRNEISDHNADLKVPFSMGPMGTLGDVLDHPDLFKAYPDLAGIKVVGRSPSVPYAAEWNPDTQQISITKRAMKDPATLLHEVQHAIQDKEGFTTGNSDEWMPTQRIAEFMTAAMKPAREAVIADRMAAGNEMSHHPLYQQWLDDQSPNRPPFEHVAKLDPVLAALYERSKQPIPGKTALDVYHQTAGEVEARNVAKRLYLSPEFRRYVSPESTEDVPRNRQYLVENIGKYFNRLGDILPSPKALSPEDAIAARLQQDASEPPAFQYRGQVYTAPEHIDAVRQAAHVHGVPPEALSDDVHEHSLGHVVNGQFVPLSASGRESVSMPDDAEASPFRLTPVTHDPFN